MLAVYFRTAIQILFKSVSDTSKNFSCNVRIFDNNPLILIIYRYLFILRNCTPRLSSHDLTGRSTDPVQPTHVSGKVSFKSAFYSSEPYATRLAISIAIRILDVAALRSSFDVYPYHCPGLRSHDILV